MVVPSHLSQCSHSDNIINLHPLDEDANEAYECKLNKGEKDHGEAEHDIEIQSSDPATSARLAPSYKPKTYRDHSQHCGGSKTCDWSVIDNTELWLVTCSSWSLLAQLSLDQPETDPRWHDNDDERSVDLEEDLDNIGECMTTGADLENIESNSSVEWECEEDDRSGWVSDTGVDLATVQTDEVILRQLYITQSRRCLGPS